MLHVDPVRSTTPPYGRFGVTIAFATAAKESTAEMTVVLDLDIVKIATG